MPNASFIETLTALAYRVASYMVSHVIDDPAMVAIIFC
jgi:hypothetical protein